MTHTTETHPPRAIARQQGFGLVELAISLTLIAVLLLGAFYIVRNIQTSTVQKEFSQSANQFMAAASKFMAHSRTTNAVTTEMLVGMGGGQADKMFGHPINWQKKAIRSAIPGVWEDIGNLCCSAGYATLNESIVYRLNRVPKEYCNFVVAELARNPSVALVTGRAWTANTDHPSYPHGPRVATGAADTARLNASVGFDANNINALCGNTYSEIFALVVPF
jgi:prepilin-type N-terminal cleavage/methylation domain-containing protein